MHVQNEFVVLLDHLEDADQLLLILTPCPTKGFFLTWEEDIGLATCGFKGVFFFQVPDVRVKGFLIA